MGKIAFMFPGQGAQYIGMGEDFYKEFSVVRDIFKLASEVSGLDVEKLCFEENEKINITEYTQIAMLTVELSIFTILDKVGIKPDAVAGLSLGEYGAVYAAGIIGLEDILSIIRKRGIYMQEAIKEGGGMTAILGMDIAEIEKICAQVEGMVGIANYNCPGQTVITGEKIAVDLATENLMKNGAKRCIPLNVSGPFHSEMLIGASNLLEADLEKINLEKIKVDYLTNVTADYVTDLSEVKGLLAKQVISPVKWQQTIEKLLEDGFDTFIEVGPGKTLTGFMKKINKDVTVYSVATIADLEKLKGGLGIC